MNSSCPISYMLGGSASGAAPSIAGSLAVFPLSVLTYAAERETHIVPLSLGQRYQDASPAIRRLGASVDSGFSRRRASSSSKSARFTFAMPDP